jgi:hypothetical protein
MRHAPKVTCDFCEAPIDTKTPWTTFEVAVPKDVAERVHDRWQKDADAAPRVEIFPGMRFHVPMPTHLSLDICSVCEEKQHPDLRPLVAVRVITKLDEQRHAAAKAGVSSMKHDD